MNRFAVALLVAISAVPVVRAQQAVPEIPFDSVPNFLKLPADVNFGEDAGVAVNSKGHVFVYTRSNSATGAAYRGAASQLFEFDQNGKFLREIGKGLYAWAFAHAVRVDKDDNIWAIDKGSDMVIKFNQAGQVAMVFGRRKESADPETSVDAFEELSLANHSEWQLAERLQLKGDASYISRDQMGVDLSLIHI